MILQTLLAIVARVILATLRVEIVGVPPVDEGGPRVYAFLHGRQFGLLRVPRPRGLVVMVSKSADGTLQAGILSRLGLRVVRGSSSRGGVEGLLGFVRTMRSGLDGGLAVDGPKGPSGIVKLGVIQAARLAQVIIVPTTFAASHAWTFHRAWDNYALPWPFARVVIMAGNPVTVPHAATPTDLERTREAVEKTLAALNQQAAARIAGASEAS